MKHLDWAIYFIVGALMAMLVNTAHADEPKCETNGTTTTCTSEKTTEDDVNTPVPDDLKDAKIVIITKDGKKHTMSANQFKVVKRQQQFKTKEKDVTTMIKYVPYVVQPEQHKNLVTLGGRYDYNHLSSSIEGTTVKLYSSRTAIFDLGYYRRLMFGNWGLGASLDTNGTPRGVIGLEF